jgi:hypothetical protein
MKKVQVVIDCKYQTSYITELLTTSLTRICERIQNYMLFFGILGFHWFIDKDCSLLGYDVMLIGNW